MHQSQDVGRVLGDRIVVQGFTLRDGRTHCISSADWGELGVRQCSQTTYSKSR